MAYEQKERDYELVQSGEETVIKINYEGKPYSPSIEDNPMVMMDAIDRLTENPSSEEYGENGKK